MMRKQESALTAESSASLPVRALQQLSASGRALLAEGFAPLNVIMQQRSERWHGRLTVKLEAVAIRGVVCSVLFALNAIALYYMYEDGAEDADELVQIARDRVDCGKNDRLCTFRLLCSLVACLLLLPYLVEMAQLSAYILGGFTREIHFERPEVLTREEMPVRSFPGRLLLAITQITSFFIFLLASPAVMSYYFAVWVLAAAFGSSSASAEAWEGLATWTWLSTTIVLFMLPDLLLTLSLFPLAVLVINNSDSIPEMVVNLIAVLFFAQLDDVLVFMLLHPRRSLGQALEVYCTDKSGGSLSSSVSAITGMQQRQHAQQQQQQQRQDGQDASFLGPEGPSASFRV